MYKIHCPKCNQYNYSASKAGKLICCYCGADLKNEPLKNETEKSRIEKLA